MCKVRRGHQLNQCKLNLGEPKKNMVRQISSKGRTKTVLKPIGVGFKIVSVLDLFNHLKLWYTVATSPALVPCQPLIKISDTRESSNPLVCTIDTSFFLQNPTSQIQGKFAITEVNPLCKFIRKRFSFESRVYFKFVPFYFGESSGYKSFLYNSPRVLGLI
nr:PREDICTED: uncharacterized protein LOC105661893 [Megachile rotundata]